METELKKKRIDEQWVILIICCLLTGATTGTGNVAGLFYGPVCNDLGILRGTFTLQNLIGTGVTTVMLMLMPKILKRVSVKRLLTFGVFGAALCYFLDSFNNGVAGFFITSILRNFAASFYNSLITFLIINSWFRKNNGIASSIMMCFSGAAGALLSPMFSSIITKYGWRVGYRAVAVNVVLFSLPILLYPRNLISAGEENSSSGRNSRTNDTGAVKKRNGTSYAILIVFLITCFSLAAFMSHVSGYCEAEGFSAEVGALALSCNLFGNMIFKLLDGFLSDRFGIRKVNMVILSLPIVAFVLFLTARNELTVYIAGFFSGAANAGAGLAANLIIRDIYGNDRFGEVKSSSSLFSQPAYSLFTAVAGYTYDFTGNYDLILIVFVVFAVIQVTALDMLYRRKAKEMIYD